MANQQTTPQTKSQGSPPGAVSNYTAYSETLTQVSPESIRRVMLHYARGSSTEPRPHIIASGLELMLRVNSIKAISLRAIIERAGYGFSRFYKLWPSLDRFHHDVWLFGLRCHSLSELEHLRQLGSNSKEDFAKVLMQHMVYAQHLISPVIFKHIMMEYANGDLLGMLAHLPEHAKADHALFVKFFPEESQTFTWEQVESFSWMMGTYLFSRLLSNDYKLDDQSTIDRFSAELLRLRPAPS